MAFYSLNSGLYKSTLKCNKISADVNPQLANMAPRGSYRRFIIVGMLNSVIFYLFWFAIIIALAEVSRGETIAWSLAWILGSLIAHFTHRMWTFDSRRNVIKTTTGTYVVYIVGLIGSTLTYDLLRNYLDSANLVFLITMALWGLIDWWLLRKLVFLYSDNETDDDLIGANEGRVQQPQTSAP